MNNMTTKEEFVDAFSKKSGYTKKSVNEFLSHFEDFLDECLENHISFKIPNLFELYYSIMKSRTTTKVGTKSEIVVYPPTIKAKMRLARSKRKKYKKFKNEILPILSKINLDKEDE
jgi:nucleoid DNA-binding protein